MTQNQTDFQKHITLVDGLLRVGMSDEALERIHALRRQHADHPDLREAEARALHQQLMCAPKPAPRLLDAFLRLDLPPEHPLLFTYD